MSIANFLLHLSFYEFPQLIIVITVIILAIEKWLKGEKNPNIFTYALFGVLCLTSSMIYPVSQGRIVIGLVIILLAIPPIAIINLVWFKNVLDILAGLMCMALTAAFSAYGFIGRQLQNYQNINDVSKITAVIVIAFFFNDCKYSPFYFSCFKV